MKLKARYGMGELAGLLEMSRRQVNGVLRRYSVPIHGVGRWRHVFVADLEKRAPHIVDSLRLLPDRAA